MTATPSEVRGARVVGALVPDPRRPGSVRILVDGRPFLTIPREVALAEGLEPGVVLGGEDEGSSEERARLERLSRAADEEAAFRTALRFLERRSFAARDLTRRLTLKSHPPRAAEAAVARAISLGLVDDARFAVGFAQTRAGRGRGPLRLRRDLASLGVERSVIEKALTEAFGEDGVPAADAAAIARRRLQQLRGLPRPVQRRRLLAFLARRGFSGSEVQGIVSGLLSGTP